ncbi:GNAT family N-acetyltransferase [Siccirubricoccus deserti]|uniref:GNAT family N-acetyltransferase n=1 Tax=Siccirubricoccus deserti TaxID=2013562 RepID=A0A9X0QXD4_9PROT|nr:GNAT family N-acetyltransferase [Siccirubricoccus deserti]MBC4015706.1 GNAT family N-acetyltransferase [Siccirubricoccus deserti]GGC43955.1 GNAT family N-acetyltransferase [Siccirubricoccus deserti]
MIRRARAEEAARLAALVEAAYAPWVPIIGRRPGPMDDDYAARIAAGEAWVLEDGGAIHGLVVIETHASHLMLDNIAVDPARKGMGDGRALLDFVEAEARRRGLAEVRLYTHALMAANIALYAKRGYAETERREEKGFSRVFMAKRVG